MPTLGAAVMAAEREGHEASKSLLPLPGNINTGKKQNMAIGKFGRKKEPDRLEFSQVNTMNIFRLSNRKCHFQNAIKNAFQSANSTLRRLKQGP